MPDKEMIIEQLEKMRDYHRSIGNNITADIANDALELLKEQEPVKPIEGDPVTQGFKYLCGKCHWKIVRNCIYCEHCGRSVKWE